MTTRILDRIARTAALLALTTVAACDDEVVAGGAAFRDGTGSGGPVFNTNVIYTSDVSVIDTTGLPLNGVQLEWVQVVTPQGPVVLSASNLHVSQGTLIGEAGGATYVGAKFLNSKWKFNLNGQVVYAKLTTVETSFAAGLYDPLNASEIRQLDPDRLVYTFHFIHPFRGTSIKTCKEDAIGGARMVLYGDLDVDYNTGDVLSVPNRIYFGCISGAIGKTALLGYAPDSPSLPSVPMPAFETATRLVRADYCADGVPHTQVGNPLTLEDQWGINHHGQIPFTTEAIWEAGRGAVCVSRIRETGEYLQAPLLCPSTQEHIPLCPTDESDVTAMFWNQAVGDIWSRVP